jgi:predicted DNA-binding protein (MmcQ/YjbR family)
LARLRKLASKWPETQELETWGHPTFRVGEKIFASYGESEEGPRIGVKATKPDQAVLIEDPRIEVAKYVGRHGWISLHADRLQWGFIAELVEQSYRLIAPKRLVRQLDEA